MSTHARGSTPSQVRELTVAIPMGLVGTRLDRAVVALVPGLTRMHAKELILGGHVRLDGATVAKPGTEIETAGTLAIEIAPRASRRRADAMSELAILHEDEHVVAIDKPAGALVHPTGAAAGGTISELAVARYGPLPALQGEDRPGIVHRLDAGTSGVMLLARTTAAFADLMQQFRARKIEKGYLAFVWGEPRFDSGVVDAPLERAPGDTSRMAIAAEGAGRPASTYYEVRERYRGLALLACSPKTGRTHQIRVHLASIGLPLVGDKLYRRRGGPPVRLPDEAPIPARQALHSERLRFRHPISGESLCIEAPLPADLVRLQRWLREVWTPAAGR